MNNCVINQTKSLMMNGHRIIEISRLMASIFPTISHASSKRGESYTKRITKEIGALS